MFWVNESKTGKERNMVIFKDKSIDNHIESSRRDLFIDMVVKKFIFQSNLSTLLAPAYLKLKNRYKTTYNRFF